MKLIKKSWTELDINEREHPAKPDEIFVVGSCQPGWPPYAVMRAKGPKTRADHLHLGLFWEWDHAVAFAEIAERMGL